MGVPKSEFGHERNVDCNQLSRSLTRCACCAALLVLLGASSGSSDERARLYESRTLDEWRELIKSLDFQSQAAADAVPGLLALVNDDQLPSFTRRQAALTLGRIGRPAQEAIPQLVSLLKRPAGSEESSTPAWAAKALSLFGPLAAPATPALVKLLRDTERPQRDRLSAVEALARIGGAHAEAIPALIQLARDDSGETHEAAQLREAAADGLALIGSAASPAVPMLIRLTREESGRLRKKAAVALGSIGRSAGIAAPSLAELVLFDELREVHETAASSLAAIGEPGEAALRKLLTDEDPAVRRLAAVALGEVPREQPANVTSLLAALNDVDTAVNIASAESLWKTTRQADPLLPILLITLTSDDRQLRIRAYRLLLALGPAAQPALPALRCLANDRRPHVRQVAIKALRQLPVADAVN